MKNILVYDTISSRCDAHCKALAGLGYLVWHYSNGNIAPYPPNDVTTPEAYDFIFHHANDDALDATTHQGRVLKYGGSTSIESGWVPRAVSPPDANLTAKEIQAFLDYVKANPQKSVDDAISFVWRDNGPLLALRLLCEAYAMPTDGSGNRNYQPNENGAKPIAVHCPDPGTWFELLGASKPAGDAKQVEAAITAFGRLMGDAGGVAMDLARAIVQPGSDIGGSAGKFVERVSEITASQAGGVQ